VLAVVALGGGGLDHDRTHGRELGESRPKFLA
jgi:hypothetical protein